jgi:hypothetical protein
VNTFRWYFKLSALHNLDGLDWLVSWLLWHILDLVHNVVALEDLTEDDVLTIQPAMIVVRIIFEMWSA